MTITQALAVIGVGLGLVVGFVWALCRAAKDGDAMIGADEGLPEVEVVEVLDGVFVVPHGRRR